PPLFGRGSIQKEKILHTLVQEEAQNIYRQGESQQFTPYYEADFLLVTAKVTPELLEVINQLKGNNIVTIIVMQRDGTKGEENIPFAKQGIVYRYITPTSYQVGDAG
ncbi:MAG: hypothetical protein ACI35O_00690, partial [Bacillaceae bacterium]